MRNEKSVKEELKDELNERPMAVAPEEQAIASPPEPTRMDLLAAQQLTEPGLYWYLETPTSDVQLCLVSRDCRQCSTLGPGAVSHAIERFTGRFLLVVPSPVQFV